MMIEGYECHCAGSYVCFTCKEALAERQKKAEKPGLELDRMVEDYVMGRQARLRAAATPEEFAKIRKEDTPAWSTDIAEAWRVIAHLEKILPETCVISLNGSRKDWHCEIDSNDGNFLLNGPSVSAFGNGESPAHAICLAALRAIGAM